MRRSHTKTTDKATIWSEKNTASGNYKMKRNLLLSHDTIERWVGRKGPFVLATSTF